VASRERPRARPERARGRHMREQGPSNHATHPGRAGPGRTAPDRARRGARARHSDPGHRSRTDAAARKLLNPNTPAAPRPAHARPGYSRRHERRGRRRPARRASAGPTRTAGTDEPGRGRDASVGGPPPRCDRDRPSERAGRHPPRVVERDRGGQAHARLLAAWPGRQKKPGGSGWCRLSAGGAASPRRGRTQPVPVGCGSADPTCTTSAGRHARHTCRCPALLCLLIPNPCLPCFESDAASCDAAAPRYRSQ
jgi:hypothetical protein